MRLILSSLCALLLPACGLADDRITGVDIETPLIEAGYVQVDLHKLQSGHDVINARLNGVDGAFVLDTGAGYSVLNADATSAFNLSDEVLRSETGAGAGGPTELTVHAVDELVVANILTPIDTIYVTELGNVMSGLSRLYGAPLSGIVGQDVLTSLGAVLDVGQETLFLHANPAAPCSSSETGCSAVMLGPLSLHGYQALELRLLTTGHIALQAELNGTIGTFLIDSGARESFLNLGDLDRFRSENTTGLARGGTINGAGGAAQSFRLPVTSFSLQDIPLQTRAMGVIDLSAVEREIAARGGGDIDGVIGQDVLQDHHAVIDLNGPSLYIAVR